MATATSSGSTSGAHRSRRLQRVHSARLRAFRAEPWTRVPRRGLLSGARRARRRVFHPGRVEGRPPAALVVARELEVVPLVRHADCDPADAGPRVEPGAERPEGSVIRRSREGGESECCSEELAALVEHALLDDLARLEEHRLRDCQAEGLGGLEVDHQLDLVGCSIGRSAGFAPFRILSTNLAARR